MRARVPFGKAPRQADPDDPYAEVDDYLKPNRFQERLPWIFLGAAWLAFILAVAGSAFWLRANEDAVMAELRAQRPQMTMNVPPPKTPSAEATSPSDLPGAHEARSDSAAEPDAVTRTAPTDREIPPAGTPGGALLQPHPDPKLVEPSENGPLPIIAADGRQPWRVYSRPFNALERRPRVAVVVAGLGISHEASESAIRELPAEVSLAFAPFTRKLPDWIDAARGSGHEVLLELPMEPADYPRSDPGPYGLLTSLTPSENLRRLSWVMSRATGYIGVMAAMGGGFTGDGKAMRPVLVELKRRGLVYVDTLANPLSVGPEIATGIDMPRAFVDRVVDETPRQDEIDRYLRDVEARAQATGVGIAVAHPYPVTLRQIRRWIATLGDKGLVLAPLSAVVNKQGPS